MKGAAAGSLKRTYADDSKKGKKKRPVDSAQMQSFKSMVKRR
jgi:hypothetical protein